LRLIEYYKRIIKRSSSHERKGRYFYNAAVYELSNLVGFHHVKKRVIERSEIRVHFLVHVSRQESQSFAGFHSRTRKNDPADLFPEECVYSHRHCKISLSRARRPYSDHDVIIFYGLDIQPLGFCLG
jgi:hypothetical protein